MMRLLLLVKGLPDGFHQCVELLRFVSGGRDDHPTVGAHQEIAGNEVGRIHFIYGLLGIEPHREAVTRLFAETGYRLARLTPGYGQKDEVASLEAVDQLRLYAGELLAARRTPGGPEIYQHRFAAQIRKPHAAAVEKRHREIGGCIAGPHQRCGGSLCRLVQRVGFGRGVGQHLGLRLRKFRVGDGAGIDALKLVYTPLNGTGLECVKKLLKKLGVTHVTVVPEQEKPDGDFPTCPYPNPEIREAMQKGLELCDKVRPDLLLGTDPDCDRCGTAVPDGKGGYRLITGNEMGIILLDYICRTRLAQGTMPADPVAVTTIVSTDMAAPVAKKYGVELRRTLTGFKFIGEQIGKLEAEGRPERYIFGFEESYGYLAGDHVRDKDAVSTSLLICQMAQYYKLQGKNLADAMHELYEKYGYYHNKTISLSYPGAEGAAKMAGIMAGLRENPPAELAGSKIEAVVDYNTCVNGLPKANVIEFDLEGGNKGIVRPSGTEPKIKLYIFAKGADAAEADAALDAIEESGRKLLA
mgnify:CR=1 FL=1